jgi:uncharacterized membrane protein YdjX (TVP38/TMEM64 family)
MAADLATHPLLYALLLAGGVGLGLPMAAAVVAAGAMFGGAIGLVVVLIGQVVGLAINWNLCRHWCRAWIVRRMQRKRRWHWILSMVDARLSWRTVLLLRLALLPMALVSACCALSATGWRGYSLASTVLVLRFAVMVQAGARGAEAISGQLSIGPTVLTGLAIAATAAQAWQSGVRLRKRLTIVEF